MPCYSCSTEFSFLKKEVGCDICGFSFCSRCCKKREIKTKQGELTKQLVCNKCYNDLNSNGTKPINRSPPLAYKKRISGLRSVSVDSGSQMPASSEWSSDKDREMAERLKRLKKDRIKADLPSEDDIAERLAKLKGMEPSKYKAPPIEVYRPPDMRTAVQQAADLMKQVTLEAELDSRLVKPEDEIAARLARLRGEEVPEKRHSPENTFLSNFEVEKSSENMDIDQVNEQFLKEHASVSETASKDIQSLTDDPTYKNLMMNIQKKEKGGGEENIEEEEEEANKLIEKLLAADVDEEELESLNEDFEGESNSKSEKDTTEEFPWCVICTEDAKIRCFDCDSDIYCLRCFKECHDTFEITDHKTCPYLSGKKTAA